MPPKIKCYEGDGKIELLFKIPNNNYAPIREYIVSLKKSYKRDGIVKLLSFKNDRCGTDSCKFVIRGLDNQDYYTVSVRAVNSVGMSEKSNEQILAPNDRQTRHISSALLDTDDELKQKVLTILILMTLHVVLLIMLITMSIFWILSTNTTLRVYKECLP